MKVEYFNATHFLFLGIALVLFLGLFFSLKKIPENSKRKFLLYFSVANTLIFVVYKILETTVFGKTIESSIPLHLCNIMIFLMPFAFCFEKSWLRSIMFYISIPGCVLALLFMDGWYVGVPISNGSLWLYFIVHINLFVTSLLMVCLGLYKPKMSHAILNGIIIFAFAGLSHVVNVIFRATNLVGNSNYFYTFGSKGNIAINFFYKLIPIPLVFQIPLLALAFGVFVFEAYICKLCEKRRCGTQK